MRTVVGYSFLRSTDDSTDTATKTLNAYTMGINKVSDPP